MAGISEIIFVKLDDNRTPNTKMKQEEWLPGVISMGTKFAKFKYCEKRTMKINKYLYYLSFVFTRRNSCKRQSNNIRTHTRYCQILYQAGLGFYDRILQPLPCTALW